MNLQELLSTLFLYDAEDGAGAGAGTDPEGTPTDDAGSGAAQDNEEAFKTFATEDEYNAELAKIAKSEKSKAKHEIMTELGITSLNDAKTAIEKGASLDDISAANEQLKNELIVVKAGVSEEFYTEALTLAKLGASEEVSLEDSLADVLKKFPNMTNKKEPSHLGGVGADKGKEKDPKDATNEILNKRFPWVK